MATRPDTFFDGTAFVTFDVTGEGADDSISTDAKHAQRGLTSSSLQEGTASNSLETNEGETSNATSFNVTFFHCDVGTFWNRTDSSVTSTGEYDGTCERCTEDDTDGDIEVRAGMSGGIAEPTSLRVKNVVRQLLSLATPAATYF